MCNTVVNSYWEAPSTKETGLRWQWKFGNVPAQFSSCCLMNYALHLEQLNKVYTGSNSKRASFCTTWAKAMSFSCWSVFFRHIFRTCSYSFFSVLTFDLPGGSVQITMYHFKRLLRFFWYLRVVLSARGHQEFSDLNARFLKNKDSERKQQFPLSYYNLMLISNPFYPYMFVPCCSLDLLSILTALDMTSWICFFPFIKARLWSLYRSKGWSLEFKFMAWNTDLFRPFQNILGEHF